MKNGWLLFYFFVFSCWFSIKGQTLKGAEINNRIRLNFMPVAMPTTEFSKLKPTMGLGGLHYQIPINKWLYTGTGMYFALTGDQGGLFTLGVEFGVNRQLFNNIYADANFHFGGGGGYRFLVNDGGFINTNIGLQYKKNNYSFGIQYSHFNFYSGKIKDNTISFFIEIPSIMRFADYNERYKTFLSENISSDVVWKQVAVKNTQQMRFDFLYPIGKSKKDNGTSIEKTLSLLGFEYQKYINEKYFLFLHTDAVYKGLRAGFMDLFFGIGYHPYQSKYINFFGKLGIGASGGRIAPEGGLTIYPTAGIDLKLFKNIAISGYGGYYRAIGGNFEAFALGGGLKYFGLSGGTDKNTEDTTVYTQGIRVEIQHQHYFKVAKTDDIYNAKFIDLQNIGLMVNYDLNKWFYIAGEASFTYKGRSGGYAHGMVGGGIYSPKFFGKKTRTFAAIMAGAGGGAGVHTDEGIVIRPVLGLSYDITRKISVLVSGGRYIAPFGKVNSSNINLGLSFNFSTINQLL